MNENCLKQPHTLQWTQGLRNHPHWKNFRFKKINSGYPQFNFPSNLIVQSKPEQFWKKEDYVMPLFVATQFGTFPKIDDVHEMPEEPLLIAKLHKSLLSGVVAGLVIGIWHKERFKEIEVFKN